jgi:hypothetical protein
MAKMVPSTIPEGVRSEAEIRVYKALERQFPDRFVVYYGRPWWDFQSNGKARLGEADFIIAGPDWGILVAEVKGGKISRDGARDIWTSTDRNGKTHQIRDPVDQARRSMFVLRDRLKQTQRVGDTLVRIGCAVVFPDCSVCQGEMGIDMPAPIFVWYDDMLDLKQRLTMALGASAARIGEQGMKALDELLAPSVSLDLRFGSVVGRAKRRIKELTDDQFWILDALGRNKRASISGGAGTGKTVLALKKAWRLASEGKATLLVCYNDGLGANLKRLCAEWRLPGLTACTYNENAEAVCQKAGVSVSLPPLATEAQKTEYYERELPQAFRDVISSPHYPRFDAVVIDEAQDFSETWIETLGLLLRDPLNSYWYAFYDDNQKILSNPLHQDALLRNRFGEPFQLTRNLRNAPEVFKRFAQYYHGDAQRAFECLVDCEGRVSFAAAVKEPADLTNLVLDLIEREGIAPSDIVLLTCGHLANSRFRVGDVARQLQTRHPGVTATSVGKFKGLESPVVVLTDVDAAVGRTDILYTAISRAQMLLYVVGTSELPTSRLI